MIVYIYSIYSSRSNSEVINKIRKTLQSKYQDITEISYDEMDSINKEEVTHVFFSGGDGTFNKIVNSFKDYLDKVIFGYIPTGTANDIARNHGIKKINDALDIIKEGVIKEENLLELNDELFIYAMSVGEMSQVSISSNKSLKKKFGKLVYKIKGIRYLFKKRKIITVNGKDMKLKVLIVLRSLYLGGVKIGKSIDDKIHMFYLRNIFDVISLFIFNRFQKVKGIVVDEVHIKSDSVWCVDGEKIEIEEGSIRVSNKKIKMLSKNTWQTDKKRV